MSFGEVRRTRLYQGWIHLLIAHVATKLGLRYLLLLIHASQKTMKNSKLEVNKRTLQMNPPNATRDSILPNHVSCNRECRTA